MLIRWSAPGPAGREYERLDEVEGDFRSLLRKRVRSRKASTRSRGWGECRSAEALLHASRSSCLGDAERGCADQAMGGLHSSRPTVARKIPRRPLAATGARIPSIHPQAALPLSFSLQQAPATGPANTPPMVATRPCRTGCLEPDAWKRLPGISYVNSVEVVAPLQQRHHPAEAIPFGLCLSLLGQGGEVRSLAAG